MIAAYFAQQANISLKKKKTMSFASVFSLCFVLDTRDEAREQRERRGGSEGADKIPNNRAGSLMSASREGAGCPLCQ